MIRRWLRKWLGIEQLQAQINELDPAVVTPRKADATINSDVLRDRITSSPIKSMTPVERSLEDSKEIREKIEDLLS